MQLMENKTISENIYRYCIDRHCQLSNDSDYEQLLNFMAQSHLSCGIVKRIFSYDRSIIEKRSLQLEQYAFHFSKVLEKMIGIGLQHPFLLTISELAVLVDWTERIFAEKRNRLFYYQQASQNLMILSKQRNPDEDWSFITEKGNEMQSFIDSEKMQLLLQKKYLQELKEEMNRRLDVSHPVSFASLQKYCFQKQETRKDSFYNEHIKKVGDCYQNTHQDIYSKKQYQKMMVLTTSKPMK